MTTTNQSYRERFLARSRLIDYLGESDYLKVHVQRIRSKFRTVATGFDPIANERGVGYRLNLVLER